MTTKELQIEGMTCGHCVMVVTKALKELNLADVKVKIGKAEVTYDETRTDENDLVSAIEEEGYKVIK
jgi:copper chaperone